MRRLVVFAVAALIGTIGSVQAQRGVNEAKLAGNIAKAEVAVQDPKKSGVASNWIKLGDAYYAAGTSITEFVFKLMSEEEAKYALGKPTQELQKTVDGVDYKVLVYPYIDLYFTSDGTAYFLQFWEVTNPVFEGTLEKAGEAYLKAHSLDASSGTTEKVQAGLDQVMNKYRQHGGNDHVRKDLEGTSKNFTYAYELSKKDFKPELDTISGYNAGLLHSVLHDYMTGEKYMKEMLDLGYEQEGETYFYLYAALFAQKKMEEAKSVLLEAIKKYPNNIQVVEGLLNVYASTGDDPNAIIPYVQKAIESDPNNPELYAGLGRVYDKLGNLDQAIEAFQTANKLLPDDFSTNFNLGFMMLKKADNMAAELDRSPITSKAAYDAGLAKVLDAFRDALPYLEKAHAANPQEAATVELLKNVYFRLRDESPEMMANYTKYKELHDSMN